MKPPQFEYAQPTSVDEVTELLAGFGDDAALLAGGQSLVPLLCLRLARPETVIDLVKVAGVSEIGGDEDSISFGAMMTARQAEGYVADSGVSRLLREALRHLAHPQIRSRTTVGGNVAHADPASELPAVLVAADGWVRLASSGGERLVGWRDFFQGPFMTARQPDEMVISVNFPRLSDYRVAFDEFSRRHGDYGIAATAVAVRIEGATIQDVRIGLAGVGATPLRASKTEEALRGTRFDSMPAPQEVATLVASELEPSDNGAISGKYRARVAGVITARALARAVDGKSVV